MSWGGAGSHNSLSFSDIASTVALKAAWQKFARGKRKRTDVLTFSQQLDKNIAILHRELLDGTYQHGKYIPFLVHDPKRRQIHKASVRDRLVHQALVTAIEPPFERRFIYDSYSCRLGKGTHAGVSRLRQLLRRESRNNKCKAYVLKCDVKQFFATIDHDLLLGLIERQVTDEQTLWLVREILLSHKTATGRGIPLGNVTSQLFANIYLHELDWFVKQQLGVKRYLRYCDDFLIVSCDKVYLQELIQPLEQFLLQKLQLQMHPGKMYIRAWDQGIDFLGYVLKPNATILRTKTKQRAIRRVNRDNLSSYLGLCTHADAYYLSQLLTTIAWQGCTMSPDKLQ